MKNFLFNLAFAAFLVVLFGIVSDLAGYVKGEWDNLTMWDISTQKMLAMNSDELGGTLGDIGVISEQGDLQLTRLKGVCPDDFIVRIAVSIVKNWGAYSKETIASQLVDMELEEDTVLKEYIALEKIRRQLNPSGIRPYNGPGKG